MKYFGFALLLALAAAVSGSAAHAGSIRGQQSAAAWRKQDECRRAAFARFQDYTAESNAKRDAATRQCEIKNNVPPRAPGSGAPVKVVPDAD